MTIFAAYEARGGQLVFLGTWGQDKFKVYATSGRKHVYLIDPREEHATLALASEEHEAETGVMAPHRIRVSEAIRRHLKAEGAI
jgi:hypothetical protein